MRHFDSQDVLTLVSGHPLIAAWLVIMFFVILFLGTLHAFRLFLRFLVVLTDEVKQEFNGIGVWLRRLREALTTWKSDP